jgi:hypothetical protein
MAFAAGESRRRRSTCGAASVAVAELIIERTSSGSTSDVRCFAAMWHCAGTAEIAGVGITGKIGRFGYRW